MHFSIGIGGKLMVVHALHARMVCTQSHYGFNNRDEEFLGLWWVIIKAILGLESSNKLLETI